MGDASVGKTLLMQRYVKGVLPKTCEPTVGVEYHPKDVKLSNNENVRLNIWDTGKYD